MTALTGIAIIAVMRSVIVFAPHLYFDTDPTIDPAPLAGLSMAGSLVLDVMLLLFCTIGIIALVLQRAFSWRLFALAFLPCVMIVYHGIGDAGDMWRGATWLGAVIAAVVVAHLTREKQLQILFAALMLAVIAPLLLRGGAQMGYEHADQVAAFESIRESILQDRGWEPDSPAAQIYERRLRQAQPTGWFYTANIYASVMLVAAVLFAGITAGAYRARMSSGWYASAALLSLACMTMVFLSGSKGAMLAMLLGLVVCLTPLFMPRIIPLIKRWGSIMLLAAVALAFLGIIARGWLLPEALLGEKSLLFRWHYLQSAAEMFMQHPLAGVGPDGVQEMYTQHRVPRNPEEVISAHSVATDWLVTLGLLGASWIALIATLLWRAGRSIACETNTEDQLAPLGSGLWIVLLTAATGLGTAILAELHVLDVLSLSVRAAGIGLYITLGAGLLWLLPRIDCSHFRWPAAAAAMALLVHGQIEMTFFLHGSVVWAMCILGLAAGGGARSTNGKLHSQWPGIMASVLVLAAAGVLFVTSAMPALAQKRTIEQAAMKLLPVGSSRQAQAFQRSDAAAALVEAYEHYPANDRVLLIALRQYEIASLLAADEQQRDAMLDNALVTADRLVHDHASLDAYAARSALHARRASINDSADTWQRAIDDAIIVTHRDPHSNTSWVSLGDVLWSASRHEEAVAAYEQALLNDANFELDTLKQLPDSRRALLRSRISAIEGE